VRLFRRREPLHVRLAREGGVSLGDRDATRPSWDTVGIHGLHRAREWDVVATADAPGLDGDRAAFVALEDGTIVVEDGPEGVDHLANAVEQALSAPYRAEAVRRDGDLWAVAARAIELVRLPGVLGEEIELAQRGEERSLVVDGLPSFGSIPALERRDSVVRARRVDGDLWELTVDPL
jgi:hypothetical protein